MNQKGFALNYLVVIVMILLVSGAYYSVARSGLFPKASSSHKGCTEELIICPGGSSVGRIPPKCEFSPCLSSAPIDETANWKTYSNTSMDISFKYPESWYVEESGTRDNPYMRIQNYDSETAPGRGYDPKSDKGKYLISVVLWEKRSAVSTFSDLKKELDKDKSADGLFMGAKAGKIIISEEQDLNISGIQVFSRVKSFSDKSFPSTKEVYLFGGDKLVVQVIPGLDVEGGDKYFDQVLSTFKFTSP